MKPAMRRAWCLSPNPSRELKTEARCSGRTVPCPDFCDGWMESPSPSLEPLSAQPPIEHQLTPAQGQSWLIAVEHALSQSLGELEPIIIGLANSPSRTGAD